MYVPDQGLPLAFVALHPSCTTAVAAPQHLSTPTVSQAVLTKSCPVAHSQQQNTAYLFVHHRNDRICPALCLELCPSCFCVRDLINEHLGLQGLQLLHVWSFANAYLIPLSPHEQHTENIQHLQLIHNLVHDLHRLWKLCSCWGVGQSTFIRRLWTRWQRCEPEAVSTGKDLLQLLLLHSDTTDVRPASLPESSSQLKVLAYNK